MPAGKILRQNVLKRVNVIAQLGEYGLDAELPAGPIAVSTIEYPAILDADGLLLADLLDARQYGLIFFGGRLWKEVRLVAERVVFSRCNHQLGYPLLELGYPLLANRQFKTLDGPAELETGSPGSS